MDNDRNSLADATLNSESTKTRIETGADYTQSDKDVKIFKFRIH